MLLIIQEKSDIIVKVNHFANSRRNFLIMKKILSLVLALFMLLPLMAGCTTLVKVDDSYDKGAIIDMYLGEEVFNFDPQVSLTDDAMLRVFSLIYEGLTTIGENGKWQNAIMKNYVIEKDEDGEFSILVYLKDSRWTDGRTVQASDFVYSWKRILDPDRKNESASLLYDIKNAREIKMGDATIDDLGASAVDTYTLQIEFERKIDLDRFFENCASVALVPLREDAISRYGDDMWAKKTTNIITNGPFCPKEIVYGQTLRLERSNYYYLLKDKNEHLDKYVVPYRLLTKYSEGSAEAQLDAFESGSIFYIGSLPLSARADYVKKATVSDMMVTHTYVFNTNNPLLNNADVRKALSMAIDRNEIVSILTFAKPATGYIPYKVFDTTKGTSFRKTGGDLISSAADLEGAKALLKSAGVTEGAISIAVRDNEADRAVADYIAGVWNQLGFNAEVNVVKTSPNPNDMETRIDEFQELYNSGDFDVIAIDMTMLSTNAFNALSQFATSFSGNGVDMNSDDYELYGHISGYSSDEYNALIETAYTASTRTSEAEALHEAEKMLINDMPVMPVVFLQDAYLVSGELSGIKSDYFGVRNFNDTKLKNYMTYKAATDTGEE